MSQSRRAAESAKTQPEAVALALAGENERKNDAAN